MPRSPEKPPIGLKEVVGLLREELVPRDLQLAEALAMSVDMGNLEARVAGRSAPYDSRGLYAEEQISSRVGGELPDFALDVLRRAEEGALGPGAAIAALWQSYYSYLLDVAESARCRFLIEYVGFELPLRNALYRMRAEKLGLDSLAQRLDEPSGGVIPDELINRLSEEPDPMARERLLDTARLESFDTFAGTDPFSIDAALSYLASALVLDRWDLPRAADAKQLLEVFA